MTEEELRKQLAVCSIKMRRVQRELAQLNAEWLALVAERILVADRLRIFEVYHAESA